MKVVLGLLIIVVGIMAAIRLLGKLAAFARVLLIGAGIFLGVGLLLALLGPPSGEEEAAAGPRAFVQEVLPAETAEKVNRYGEEHPRSVLGLVLIAVGGGAWAWSRPRRSRPPSPHVSFPATLPVPPGPPASPPDPLRPSAGASGSSSAGSVREKQPFKRIFPQSVRRTVESVAAVVGRWRKGQAKKTEEAGGNSAPANQSAGQGSSASASSGESGRFAALSRIQGVEGKTSTAKTSRAKASSKGGSSREASPQGSPEGASEEEAVS